MKAVIAYVPVIHQGYIDFFAKAGGSVYLMDEMVLSSLQNEVKALLREPRKISSAMAVQMLRSVFANDGIGVNLINLSGLGHLKNVVMPDEDVSHAFAKYYLDPIGGEVEYRLSFLRWGKALTLQETIPNPEHVVATEVFHQQIMAKARQLAGKSADWWRQVACLVVKDGEVLFAERNKHMPSDYSLYINGDPRSNFDAGEKIDLSTAAHAEASIVAIAAGKGIALAGADAYVTTFPCPPCARALALAGIRRVYYADGYSLLDAEHVLKDAGVEIIRVSKT